MGVIPMQEDSGVQELYTRDHGTVKVDKVSFQDGGHHIVKCPNGTYMHANGLPVRDEKELRAAIPQPFLQDALNWFKNRHDQLENPVRPIAFHADGYPIFTDGTVPDFDDLYAFFKPGPILTAAIVALQDYKKRQESGQAPKELRKAAEPLRSEEEVKDAFKAATKPDPLKYSPKARGEAKAKAKRAAGRAAKTKAASAPAVQVPAQG